MILVSEECEKAKTFVAIYLTKFSISLDGIWYTVDTYWSDELDIRSISFT